MEQLPQGHVTCYVKTSLFYPAPFNKENQAAVTVAAAAMEPLNLPDDVEMTEPPYVHRTHPDFRRIDGTFEPVGIIRGRLRVERQLNVGGTIVNFPENTVAHIFYRMNGENVEYIRAELQINAPQVPEGEDRRVEAVLYVPPPPGGVVPEELLPELPPMAPPPAVNGGLIPNVPNVLQENNGNGNGNGGGAAVGGSRRMRKSRKGKRHSRGRRRRHLTKRRR